MKLLRGNEITTRRRHATTRNIFVLAATALASAAVALLVGAVGAAQASAPPTDAAGTFTQSAITSLELRLAGPNTILEQTTEGLVDGTLTGSFEDDLRVVIHPDERFTAKFTLACECTVEGRQGVLELVLEDAGAIVSPAVATFAGRAAITGGTGELSGLHGVLEVEGTVDLTSGLSTYSYSGQIHFDP